MNLRIRVAAVLLLFGASACGVGAAANVQIANARARATAPGQTTAVVYMDITSNTDATLVSAVSAIAERVEMHSMTMDGGVMRMRPLPKVELRKGATVRLAPNGTHLMLVNVKRPLKAGETVALTLRIQTSASALVTVEVQAPVVGMTETPAPAHAH